MADKKLTDLTVITQANVDNNVLIYVVDVTGGTVDRQVNRANLYLAVANTWTKGQTFTPNLATALSTTPPTVPVGSGSPFFAALAVNTGTTAFATTAQTGDFDTIFVGQVTLTNPSSGTITNAASVKIVGAPIASTNVTITNNYAFWIAAGITRIDEQIKLTSTLNTPLQITATSAPVGSSSEFIGVINKTDSTVGFVTTAQTGDYIGSKFGQATLTGPSAGTITNASTIKITGAPIASTNVTITNAYSLWVAAGTTLLQATTMAGTLTMSGANIAIGTNQLQTSHTTILDAPNGAFGLNALQIQANQFTNYQTEVLIMPEGTNNTGVLAILRQSSLASTNYEGLLMATDWNTTNEFAILSYKNGTGSNRPINIYQQTTKLMSFDVANTITCYVEMAIQGASAPLLQITSTSSSITPQIKMTDANGTPNNWGISMGYATATDGILNFVYNTSNVSLSLKTDLTVQIWKTISTYNNISTVGLGVPALYGLDNRSGLTSADGSATTLYAVPSGTGKVFRITADIFATAFTSGTATYTITWTENSVTRTLVVNATALNTLGTLTDLINPDASTNITGQLTGVFVATVKVVGLVEQIA